MSLPRILIATALVALALPAAAQAAPPWSGPGHRSRLGTARPERRSRRRRDRVQRRRLLPGRAAAPQLRSTRVAAGAAERWPGATNFDSQFSAFAAGDQLLYVGSNGEQRVNVALAAGRRCAVARVAARAEDRRRPVGGRTRRRRVQHVRRRATWATSISCARRRLTKLGPTQRLSGRGHIRSVAWPPTRRRRAGRLGPQRHDRVAHLERAARERLTAVRTLGETKAAMHLRVALGRRPASDRRMGRPARERGRHRHECARDGDGAQRQPRLSAAGAARSRLFPDPIIPGGRVIEAAYTSTGRGVIAWSGRNAVRAAFVDSAVGAHAAGSRADRARTRLARTSGSGTLRSRPRAAPWWPWSPRSTPTRTRSSLPRWRRARRRSGRPRWCRPPAPICTGRRQRSTATGCGSRGRSRHGRRQPQSRGGVPAAGALTGRSVRLDLPRVESPGGLCR